MTFEKATLAGGCFWCIEKVFSEKEGVIEAVSGYAGGTEENATYEKVKTGKTGHRESVQLKFDPSKISYREVLEEFWNNIDPTDDGGQFADRGPQYTTAIYYHSEEQKRVAEESRRELGENGNFGEKIATEIEEFTTFFPAEERHQNYSEKNPRHYSRYKNASGRKDFLG